MTLQFMARVCAPARYLNSPTLQLTARRRAKLFKWGEGNAGMQWKERGVGDVRLLKHKSTSQVRRVMVSHPRSRPGRSAC